MARISIHTFLLSILIWCLLAEKGVCRPNSNEETEYDEASEYLNDDDDEYGQEEDDPYSGLPPKMISSSLNLEVKPGERVSLPCEAENLTHVLGIFSVIWEKDSKMLFVDGRQGFNEGDKPHFKYNNKDNSLEIISANPDDSGTYYCSFSSDPKVGVSHVVNVFAPAEVQPIKPIGPVFKGSPFSLDCNVTGYPVPKVKWIKKGKHDSGEGSVVSSITVYNVSKADRHDSGTYMCIAENDQGPPASSQVNVRVQYEPEVSVEEDMMRIGVGHNVTLKCVVHAEPKARVQWFKNNTHIVVSPSSHLRIYNEGHNKHFLNIGKVQATDFDIYSCNATNSLGSDGKHIEISGKPYLPELKKAENAGTDGIEMEWHTISYSPITEYVLLYKPQKDGVNWVKERPAVVDAEEGNIYVLRHKLTNLSPGDFVVTLRAGNLYGWTNQAKPHHFTITKENHEMTADTNKFEEEENHEVTAETSKLEEGVNSRPNESNRPRIMAILTIISLSSFFL